MTWTPKTNTHRQACLLTQQTLFTVCCLLTRENKLPFSIFCLQKTAKSLPFWFAANKQKLPFSISSIFRINLYIYWNGSIQYIYIQCYINEYFCWNSKRRLPFIIRWSRKTNFSFPLVPFSVYIYIYIYICLYMYISIYISIYIYIYIYRWAVN